MFPFTPTCPMCSLYLLVFLLHTHTHIRQPPNYFPQYSVFKLCVSRVVRKQASYVYKNNMYNSNFKYILYIWLLAAAWIAQSVKRLATGWTVWGSNPGGEEIFCSRPDRHWGPPSLPYNGYRVFPGVKRPECGVDHPPPSCGEVEGRVELYICSSSRPSWPVLGRSLLYRYIWLLAVFTECEWTVNEAKGMCAGMMQTKDRKIWQWCGHSIYRIYHWTLNSPIEWTWEHYIVLYVSFIGVVKTTLLTGFPGEYRISVRLNICVWCGAGRERENNLLQHNMILNIFCNSCLGISNTVRPFCVFFL